MSSLRDIFRHQPKAARRLYSFYLSRLAAARDYNRVVYASRRIRTYARAHGNAGLGDFSYSFEIDALCRLGNFAGAWRQLRRLERRAYGRNIDLGKAAWARHEVPWLAQYHAPILYFLHKYPLASHLFEAVLADRMAHPRKGLSYDLLGYIYNPVIRPRLREEVTLYHLYRRLKKSLVEWPKWEQFITGFDAKVFTLARIQQAELVRDPSLLRPFYQAIQDERSRRLIARISTGEEEIIEPAAKTQGLQRNISEKRAAQARIHRGYEQQLAELFPDLRRYRSL